MTNTNGSGQVYIGISGNIGAGKSVLTRFIENDYDAKQLLFSLIPQGKKKIEVFHERVNDNKWLPLCYEDPERWGFQAQIQFLNSRLDIQRERMAKQGGIHVDDRVIWEDVIFAYVNLKKRKKNKDVGNREFDTYRGLYEHFISDLLLPDVLIYMEKSAEDCLAGIVERGRGFEKEITLSYLNDLHEEYQKFFKKYKGLVINVPGGIDLKTSRGKLVEIIRKTVEEVRSAREKGIVQKVLNP